MVILAAGFEDGETTTIIDVLRRAGFETHAVSLTGELVTGAHGMRLMADLILDSEGFRDYDMIVLPGGLGGVASARASQAALDALRWGWEHDRFVAAICAGPTVLADLGISDGKKATCFPGCEGQMGKADMIPGVAALRDGKLITGTSAGCAIPFALELIKALKGSEAADKVAKQIVIR